MSKGFKKKCFIFLSICLAFCIITKFGVRISMVSALGFFVFQVLGILLPGMAISTSLKKSKFSQVEFLGVSYASGYVLGIVIYFLLMPLGLADFYWLLYLVLDVFSVWILAKKKDWLKELKEDRAGFTICILFFIIALGIQFFSVAANNIKPVDGIAANTYYGDLLYWTGNTIELNNGFPPINFRAIWLDYTYHYFSSIQLSVIYRIFDIPAFDLNVYFAYFQSVFLMFMGAYCLFKRFLKENKFIFPAMFILLFTVGNEALSMITYSSHLYKASFGFDSGFALGMFAVYLIGLQLEKEKTDFVNLVYTVLFFGACLGSKGPVGLIVLCILGFVCLYWFFVKRKFTKGFLYGGLLLVIFAGIFIISLSENAFNNLTVGSAPTDNSIVNIIGVSDVYFRLKQILPNFIAQICFLIYYAFISHFWIFLLFSIGCIYKLFNIRKLDIIDFCCVMGTLIGLFLTRTLVHDGRSQVYFLMSAYPYAMLFGMKNLREMWNDGKEKYPELAKRVCGSKVAYTLVGGFFGLLVVNNFCIFSIQSTEPVNDSVKKGYQWLVGSDQLVLDMSVNHEANYLSADELQGYEWMKENTAKDAVFVSDLCTQGYERYPYNPGVFAERYLFVPISNFMIKQAMDGNEEYIRMLKEGGVDYLIQTMRVTPVFDVEESLVKKVYSNKELVIYEIM